jgi:dinuclear metal center YbgI/SA1388 family protein
MTGKHVANYLERWIPRNSAWERDSVGLQVGDPDRAVENVMLCLDAIEEVVDEAAAKNCSLIISHHPPFFLPLKRLDTANDRRGKLIARLVKNDVSLYSHHTNFDFAKDGVSFRLAEKLGLKDVRFLRPLKNTLKKLVVFVPEEAVEAVADAIYEAGGGVIGDYTRCGFRSEGTGTFYGGEGTDPAVGEPGKDERAREIRLEVLAPAWRIDAATRAMIDAHPYEEVAYDVFPLDNDSVNQGEGAIGALPAPLALDDFLANVARALGVKALRHCLSKSDDIKTVAVAGGAGSSLARDALANGADAFVTADVSYHTFEDFHRRLAIVDAGHHETEAPGLDGLRKRLEEFFASEGHDGRVLKTTHDTNPMISYIA